MKFHMARKKRKEFWNNAEVKLGALLLESNVAHTGRCKTLPLYPAILVLAMCPTPEKFSHELGDLYKDVHDSWLVIWKKVENPKCLSTPE